MAITCSQCGRRYDESRFEFGRTINCACGARVGHDYHTDISSNGNPKIFADVNAARVVRWLRAIGIDTLWEDAIPDAELVRRALAEKRYVVTLDKRMLAEWRADNILLLHSEKPLAQFREIVTRLNIEKPAALFERCLVCNTRLEEASAARIIEKEIPLAVRRALKKFFYCPVCDKIYWEGSHTARMRAEIEKVFDECG